MNTEISLPLNGQINRQASDSMLGYDYQIWRSLEVWIKLKDDEILYLECAEDFDLMTPKEGIAHQVKNTDVNITLGSKEIHKVIENHWINVLNNPEKSVKLRFMTRGGVGLEKGKPFGDDRGIDLWEMASKGNSDAEKKLTDYLIKNINNNSFREFMGEYEAEERINKIYKSIEWVVNQPVIEAVRLSVTRATIDFGNRKGIVANVSEGVVATLLDKCRMTAQHENPELRSLTLHDFQLIFEEKTSIKIPATQAMLMQLSSSLAMVSSPSHSLDFANYHEAGELPPLPLDVMTRTTFCNQLIIALNYGPILIVGTEGKGKSIVANLISKEVRSVCHWVSLPDELDRVFIALERVLLLIRGGSDIKRIILDDVPAALGMHSQVWIRLSAIFMSARQFSIEVVMTAKGVPGNLVDSRFRDASIQVIEVPILTEEEVESYFSSLGCPDDRKATLAKYILLQSGNGHPKLVYLGGIELRDKAWPMLTIESFVKAPSSIEEARENARQSVGRTVSDPDKAYLYALSVSTAPFTKEFALNLGDKLNISSPGDVFDRLAGRWIETRRKEYYSVTSLLSGQASKIYSASYLCKLNGLIFDSFMQVKSIDVINVMGIFFHAYQSNDPAKLLIIITNILQADFKEVEGLADSLEILLSFNEGNTFLLNCNAHVTAVFRHLQFKLAAHSRPEKLVEISKQWSWAITKIEDEKIKLGCSVIRGISIATALDNYFPPEIIIKAIVDASKIEEIFGENPIDFDLYEWKIKKDGFPLSFPGMLFMFSQMQCNGNEYAASMLQELNSIDYLLRNKILEAFEFNEMHSISMITKAWLVEVDNQNSDFVSLLKTLELAGKYALEWKSKGLGVNVAKVMSLIFDEEEKFNDKELALKVLDDAENSYGVSPIIYEQKANVEFRDEKYSDALKYWDLCLDYELNDNDKLQEVFAFRKAAISASKLGDYDRAAKIFESAARIKETQDLLSESAFNIEAAYCYFKNGNLSRGFELLMTAAMNLNGTYDPVKDFNFFRAQKFCASCALWVQYAFIRGEIQVDEPVVGLATSPEKLEIISTLPPAPYEVIATVLLKIGNYLNLSPQYLGDLKMSVTDSQIPAVRLDMAVYDINESIREFKFENIGDSIKTLCRAYWQMAVISKSNLSVFDAATYEVSEEIKKQPFYFEWLFVVIMAITKMKGGSFAEHIPIWKAQLSSADNADIILSELKKSEDAFSKSVDQAWDVVKQSPSFESIAAASIILSQDRRRASDTSLMQMCLVTWIFSSQSLRSFRYPLIPVLANIFSNQWSPHLSFPAGLVQPGYHIPLLMEAMQLPGPANRRLKKLIHVGASASGAEVSIGTRHVLDAL